MATNQRTAPSASEQEAAESNSCSSSIPLCFLIVHNVAKRGNIGTLVRSATAFNVKQIVVAGRREISSFGSHGSMNHVDFIHFYSLQEAAAYLKGSMACQICGVEIHDAAQPVSSQPFKGNTAFLLGNEGSGLSPSEAAICDSFVYIPQYGGGTASLNVTVAASIVLHHFALWAGYMERQREGSKFVVAAKPVRRMSRSVVRGDSSEIREERRRRAEQSTHEMEGLDDLFRDEVQQVSKC